MDSHNNDDINDSKDLPPVTKQPVNQQPHQEIRKIEHEMNQNTDENVGYSFLMSILPKECCLFLFSSRKNPNKSPLQISKDKSVRPNRQFLFQEMIHRCMYGKVDELKNYLDHVFSDLRGKDQYGRSAIHYSCIAGNFDVVKYLLSLEETEENEIKLENSDQPLGMKMKNGKTEEIYLGEINIEIPNMDIQNHFAVGDTPAFNGKTYNDGEELREAVEKVAFGENLVLKTQCKSNPDTKSTALVNSVDEEQKTALHWVCVIMEPSLEIVQLLLGCGADLEMKDCDGNTPFLLSCMNHNRKVAELLLDRGADHTAKNHKGQNYSLISGSGKHKDFLSFIESKIHSVKMSSKDTQAITRCSSWSQAKYTAEAEQCKSSFSNSLNGMSQKKTSDEVEELRLELIQIQKQLLAAKKAELGMVRERMKNMEEFRAPSTKQELHEPSQSPVEENAHSDGKNKLTNEVLGMTQLVENLKHQCQQSEHEKRALQHEINSLKLQTTSDFESLQPFKLMALQEQRPSQCTVSDLSFTSRSDKSEISEKDGCACRCREETTPSSNTHVDIEDEEKFLCLLHEDPKEALKIIIRESFAMQNKQEEKVYPSGTDALHKYFRLKGIPFDGMQERQAEKVYTNSTDTLHKYFRLKDISFDGSSVMSGMEEEEESIYSHHSHDSFHETTRGCSPDYLDMNEYIQVQPVCEQQRNTK